MSKKLKQKQLILLAILGAGILAAGLDGLGVYLKKPLGVFSWRLAIAARKSLENRELGMAAAKQTNYFDALKYLSQYLRKPEYQKDIEALYQYAIARREVPAAGGKNIFEAIGLFKAVLERDPGHKQARKDLLALYGMVAYNTEAIELADKMVREDSKDYEALRYKALSLGRLRKFDEALKVTDKVLELAPDNVPAMMMRVETMYRLDRPQPEIIKYAAEMLEKHPDDPKYEVIVGYAHALLQEGDKARDVLRKTAQREMTDIEFIRLMVFQLDSVMLFDDGLNLLRRSAVKTKDPMLLRLLVRRLWEASRFDEMLEVLDPLELKNPKTHSELLALKAMGLVGMKRDAEKVKEIIDLLAGRSDASARAWKPVLAEVVSALAEPKKVIEICRLGLTADPTNPYIRYFLGEAYNSMGEQELALEHWKQVLKTAPTWAMPYVRIAQGLTSSGRSRSAVEVARQAVIRAPSNAAALSTFAATLASALEVTSSPDPKAVKQLRDLLEKVQAAVPGEINTLPIWIDELGKQGKTDPAKKQQAIDAIHTLLDHTKLALEAIAKDKSREKDREKLVPEQTLVRLAGISREYELFVEKECFEMAETIRGMTPTLAYAKAAYMRTYESPEAGKKFLSDLMNAPERKDQLIWRLQWAQFLASIRDPDAKQVWQEIADANPDNLNIQRRVMSIPSVQDDRAFMDRVIKRVQAGSGDEGMSWKLARARWLLSGEDSRKDASTAVVMLTEMVKTSPDLIEPRILLAAAMQKVDNTGGAVEQLNAATNLQPDNLDVIVALARLRLSQGDYTETRRLVDRILSDPDAKEAHLRQVASMQSQMGDLEKSLQTMVKVAGDEKNKDAPPDLMLAELYFRTNQPKKAEPIFRALMDHPNEVVIQAYANFLGAMGRVDEAKAALAKLDGLKLDPGLKEMIHAEFARRFLKPELAIANYEAAIKLVPQKPVPYLNLMTFYVDLGAVEQMLGVNERAHKEIPSHKVFTLIDSQKEIVKSVVGKPQLQRMVAAIITDNEYRESAVEAMRIMYEANKNKERAAQTLLRLRGILDKSPRFLSLHIMMVDLYAAAGRYDEATSLATRTMTTFPNNSEPAEQAVRVLAAQRKWDETLATAQKWRDRSQVRPLAPDVAIAEAYLNMKNTAKALATIEPYKSDALKMPAEFFGVVTIMTRAMAASGKTDEAANILKPLLPTNTLWRSMWIIIAMNWIPGTDNKLAAEWLDRVRPTIPDSAQIELIDLAEQWYRLGLRAKNAEYKKKGVNLIREVASRPDAEAGASTRYGIIAYQEGDTATSEEQYRKAIARNPNMPVALNNLAMLLVDQNSKLDDALAFAKKCVELDPNSATYYDTLATVHLKRKEFGPSVDALRTALQIEPGSIEWRINLAGVHIAQANKDEAIRVMREVDALEPNFDRMNPEVKKRYKSNKDALAAAASAELKK